MPITHNLAPPSVSSEFGMAIGWGLVKGYTRTAAFGHNPSIDTTSTPEDVWPGGGLYPWMTSATTLEMLSTNVNDSSAGTGARTVLVSGLDVNYVAVTQLVTLNGTTPVTLITPLFRINNLIVMSAGSSVANLGDISVRDAGGGTVRAMIATGLSISQQAPYTVPAGFTLQIVSIYCALNGSGANRTADISTYFKTNTGVQRFPITLSTAEGNPYRHDAIPGIIVTEKTDFSLQCTDVSNNASAVTAAWLGILRQNT